MKANPSIRGRLTALLILGPGIILCISGFLLNKLVGEKLLERFDRSLETKVLTMATLTMVSDGEIELHFGDEIMPEYEDPEGPGYFEVWLPEGLLLERSYSLEYHNLRKLIPDESHSPTICDVVIDETISCRAMLIHFMPENEDQDIEANLHPQNADPELVMTAIVAMRRDELDRDLAFMRWLILASFSGAFIAMILFSRWSVDYGLRPVHEIAAQVQAIKIDQREQTLSLDHLPQELRPIVDPINALLIRIEQAISRERQFTSDVAHELRTPLAELRSIAEIGARHVEDTEFIRTVMQDALDASMQLQNMVDSLLRLARSEGGVDRANTVKVPLVPIVEHVWKQLESDSQARQIQAQFEYEDRDARVAADTDMLQMVLTNLIGNAVFYAPEGGIVSVSASSSSQLKLTISNPCVGLSEEDMTHLFDRFWRKDAARTSSTHSGLGLSLVSSYCALMNVDIEASLTNNIISFTLTFPLS